MASRFTWALLLFAACTTSSRGVSRLRIDLSSVTLATTASDALFVKAACANGTSMKLGPLPIFSEAIVDVPACGPASLELVLLAGDAATYLSTVDTDLVDGQVVDVVFAAYPAGTVKPQVAASLGACALELTSVRSEADAPRVRATSATSGDDTVLVALAGGHEVHCFDPSTRADKVPPFEFTVVRGAVNTLIIDEVIQKPTRPPDGAQSKVTATRTSGIAPDGIDSTTLTVSVRASDGAALPGVLVHVVGPSDVNATPAVATTDGTGQATFTVTSTTPGDKIITVEASFDGQSIALGSPLTISFIDGSAIEVDVEVTSLFLSTNLLVDDPTDFVDVGVYAERADDHTPAVAAQVVMTFDAPFAPSTATVYTGADGVAHYTLYSVPLADETVLTPVVHAVVNGFDLGGRTITIEPRIVSQTQSHVVSDVSYAPANGQPVTVHLFANDQKGRPVSGQTFTASNVQVPPRTSTVPFPLVTAAGEATVTHASDEPTKVRFDFTTTLHNTSTTLSGFVNFGPALRPAAFDDDNPSKLASIDPGHRARVSGDGSYVVFVSDAALVPQDTNAKKDVYRYCLNTAVCTSASRLELISVDTAGTVGNDESGEPDISEDGRYVVFTSLASNLSGGPTDANGSTDIFVRDTEGFTTYLVSISDGANVSFGGAHHPAISDDGSTIVFESTAGNAIYSAYSFSAGASQILRAEPVYGATPENRSTMRLTLVTAAGPSLSADGNSYHPSVGITGGGTSRVVFETTAQNLVGATPVQQVVQCDVPSGEEAAPACTLVSSSTTAAAANGVSSAAHISGDGNWVVFVSAADDLLAADANDFIEDVYIWGPVNGTPAMALAARCTTSPTGQGCHSPRVSDDGRYVLFDTVSTELAGTLLGGGAGDGDPVSDVYVTDRIAKLVRRVSEMEDAANGLGVALGGDITKDGTLVALTSGAPLTAHAFAGSAGVYTTPNPTVGGGAMLASGFDGGDSADVDAGEFASLDPPALSADGRYMAFSSRATIDSSVSNYQTCTGPRCIDVFWVDLLAGKTRLVSRDRNFAATSSFGDARHPAISGDGRYVVFDSAATDLVPYVYPGEHHVYRYDAWLDTLTIVDANRNNQFSPSGSVARFPTISHDGRYVAFESDAPHGWLQGDSDAVSTDEIYRRDMNKKSGDPQIVQLVSFTATTWGGQSHDPSISADGNVIAFRSQNQLLSVDTNGVPDVYVAHMAQASMELASRTDAGAPANGTAREPSISADGQWVVFDSDATNLVTGYAAGALHSPYVRKIAGANNQISVVSRDAAGQPFPALASCFMGVVSGFDFDRGGDSDHCTAPTISADGRYVSFVATSPSVVPTVGTFSATPRVYVWDRVTNSVDFAQGSGPIVEPLSSPFETTVAPNYWGRISADGRKVALIHTGLDYGYTNQVNDESEVIRVPSPFFSRVQTEPSGGSHSARQGR